MNFRKHLNLKFIILLFINIIPSKNAKKSETQTNESITTNLVESQIQNKNKISDCDIAKKFFSYIKIIDNEDLQFDYCCDALGVIKCSQTKQITEM